MTTIEKNLNKFTQKKETSGEKTFHYWYNQKEISFITASFISHLIDPKNFPIVDQHNIRATRYFLNDIKYPHKIKKKPNSIEEIKTINEFINHFSNKKNVTTREFDKYLMMFGKNVAPR